MQPTYSEEMIEEGVQHITSASFSKRGRSERWTDAEVELLYEVYLLFILLFSFFILFCIQKKKKKKNRDSAVVELTLI